jgi:hypothetical protein
MTKTTDIPPALTPDEWTRLARPNMTPEVRRGPVGVSFGWPSSGIWISGEHSGAGLPKEMTALVMAVANHALPNDAPIVAKLAALLPPE